MTDTEYAAAPHYDRVTPAWRLLLGEELHYGLFRTGEEDLAEATAQLTARMAHAARLDAGLAVLDVGCGTGAPACAIARDHAVRVVGVTTSQVGVDAATARASAAGLADRVRFAIADGMDNGFAAESFDRVWVLESSHLMPERDRLVAECARVLRPGGRIALCDIVRRRDLSLLEIRSQLREFQLLRRVFGQARMETLEAYRELLSAAGLVVDEMEELTVATRPTFERWRANAAANRDTVAELLGPDDYAAFVDSTNVLESFWADGTLGYGLIAATKPR
ncbi:MAG: SAM-dependent methyltransferase [Jatrophihabitantaceae bacterium]